MNHSVCQRAVGEEMPLRVPTRTLGSIFTHLKPVAHMHCQMVTEKGCIYKHKHLLFLLPGFYSANLVVLSAGKPE